MRRRATQADVSDPALGQVQRLDWAVFEGWENNPLEGSAARVANLREPLTPERPRRGEAGRSCQFCGSDEWLWRDDHWRLQLVPDTGLPLALVLFPVSHVDLPDLSPEMSPAFGALLVHLGTAVEALPGIARAHFYRWGDAEAHMHIVVYARPNGHEQLKGRFLPIWERLLPSVDRDAVARNGSAVAQALMRRYGGETRKLGSPA